MYRCDHKKIDFNGKISRIKADNQESAFRLYRILIPLFGIPNA